MINRRTFLEITAGAGAAMSLTPALLRVLQQSQAQLIQRAIPSTGEMLPVIGLGFAKHAECADPASLREVLKTFCDNGGRLLDTKQGYGTNAELIHATLANELGIQDKLFLGLEGLPSSQSSPRPQPSPAIVRNQIDTLFARFGVSKLDLVQLPDTVDPACWGVLKEAKNAGRIRYIGAIVGTVRWQESEAVMRNEPIDFISVDYAVDRRAAEERILPLALERKIGVMASRVFGGANGASCTGGRGLFGRVGNTPLPDWAAEFDARSWAQFFLKYVISHPAITAVRVGTTKSHHMLDNIGGGMGRLPDESTRRRMAQYVDGLPGATVPPPAAVPTAILDRYVGEYRTAAGLILIFRRDGNQLLLKEGANPYAPLWPHSETRFGQGPVIEFQVDSAGIVTGLILEQGNPVQKTLASRIR